MALFLDLVSLENYLEKIWTKYLLFHEYSFLPTKKTEKTMKSIKVTTRVRVFASDGANEQ